MKFIHSFLFACFSGIFRGGTEFLIRAKLAMGANGVSMQFTARSSSPEVAELICAAVG